jgi:uncharacterized membrane protein
MVKKLISLLMSGEARKVTKLYQKFDFIAIYDLGIQEQVINNIANGLGFTSSPEVDNFLGIHFSLIFLPISFIYKIAPFTYTLFIIQTFAVILGLST